MTFEKWINDNIWTLVNFLNCFEREGSLCLVLSGRQQVLWLANQPPVLEIQEEGRHFGCGRVCSTASGTMRPHGWVCSSSFTDCLWTLWGSLLSTNFHCCTSFLFIGAMFLLLNQVISKEMSSWLLWLQCCVMSLLFYCVYCYSYGFMLLPWPDHSRLTE